MGFTSIKVREEDKADLDRLLHEAALRTGEEISQHELVHRLIQHALRSKAEFLGKSRRKPLARRDWARYQFSLPVATDSRRVDEVVYGLEP